jgi:hypothetical protein
MPATRTISSLAATFTQAQLRDALITAFTNAGFSSPTQSFTSGSDLIVVFPFVVNAGNTYGTSYVRLRISSAFGIFQQMYATWNTGTSSGTGNSTEVSYGTLSSSVNITFNSLNGGSEYKLIALTQNTTFIPLGMIAPANLRSSWNLNSWTWGFIFTSTAMTALRSTTINQYSNADFDIALAGNSRLASANSVDGERDILTGLILLSQANQGFSGKTSDELGIVAANGSTRYDTVTKSGTTEQYLIVGVGSGGLAVRIA